MIRVYVVQSRDGARYLQLYATREAFLERYDAEYRKEAGDPNLDTRIIEAVDAATETPGAPVDLGDGDTVVFEQVIE